MSDRKLVHAYNGAMEKIVSLEVENARLQFELTAARNEIEIADGVIKRLQAKNARLRADLEEANQMLRSAYSVAERKGLQTNWEAFERQLADLLKRQHEARRALEGKGE